MTVYYKFALIALVFSLAFFPTLADLMRRWTTFDESQSHGLFVVALFFYLCIEKLKQSQISKIQLNWAGMLILASCSILWFVAALLNIETIEQLILLPIIFSAGWSLIGLQRAISIAPAIMLLIFAIPIWDFLTPTLVDLSSHVVSALVRFSKITALIEGNSIYLPGGRIDIADGCSGIRYLTISIVLGAYLMLTSSTTLRSKIALILTAVSIGLIANWLRIYIIVMVAHFTDMQASLVKSHETFGWFLFIIVCLPLWYLARILPTPETRIGQTEFSARAPKALIIATVFALASGPLLYHVAKPDFSAPHLNNWGLYGYQKNQSTLSTSPYQLPASKLHLLKYQFNSTIEIAINWRQGRNDDLVPYRANNLNRNLWTLVSEHSLKGHDQHAKLTMFRRKLARQFACTVSWYQVGDFQTKSYHLAKLLQIPALIQGQNQFVALTVTEMISEQNCESLENNLVQIATAAAQEIQLITN